jgi:hypothetical protein
MLIVDVIKYQYIVKGRSFKGTDILKMERLLPCQLTRHPFSERYKMKGENETVPSFVHSGTPMNKGI